jgi:hypothetical protein
MALLSKVFDLHMPYLATTLHLRIEFALWLCTLLHVSASSHVLYKRSYLTTYGNWTFPILGWDVARPALPCSPRVHDIVGLSPPVAGRHGGSSGSTTTGRELEEARGVRDVGGCIVNQSGVHGDDGGGGRTIVDDGSPLSPPLPPIGAPPPPIAVRRSLPPRWVGRILRHGRTVLRRIRRQRRCEARR